MKDQRKYGWFFTFGVFWHYAILCLSYYWLWIYNGCIRKECKHCRKSLYVYRIACDLNKCWLEAGGSAVQGSTDSTEHTIHLTKMNIGNTTFLSAFLWAIVNFTSFELFLLFIIGIFYFVFFKTVFFVWIVTSTEP